jgi:O-antigen biosynthesis protein WbqP
VKRLADFIISFSALVLLTPCFALIALAVRLDSPGPALYWSRRFGRNGTIFLMPKFRTMRVGTPQLPTHLLRDGQSHLTGIGGVLRKTSLDELPQLWSVLIGNMSLVGPRPALFNQHDLMELRFKSGVAALRPGITGWAQVNGRDELSIAEKVAYESDYLSRKSLYFDFKIMFLTIARVIDSNGVSH